ncbi:MAG: 50S ribosomal protein L4 [Deltaproteobacteria bacterium RIFCSPHIGHO2_02_FULL_40_11]|nr:MAG: 50S ribosomal protein L4 [Deltaproteobacteria bacterium RIFCSPHIGHO2_02_FULL_40_11]
MAKLDVYDQLKKKVSDLVLEDAVFAVPLKKHLLYEGVLYHDVNRRAGTASTKTRGEVRGGGVKPFKQKGTGRARQGSIRSPLLVGGGTIFGPKPKKYVYDLTKKTLRNGLKTVLSQKAKENKIFVLKDLNLKTKKTKDLFSVLKKFSLNKGLIVDEKNDVLKKTSKNLKSFKYLSTEGLNVYDVLRYENMVVTEKALLTLQKRLMA